MTMKNTAILLFIASAFLVSCNSDKSTPGYTFMDDMYDSPSLETYSAAPQFANGLEAQKAVDGTIARGVSPYELPNTNEAYEASKAITTWPEGYGGEMDMEEAKNLYNIFCSSCHGEKGDGQGWLVQQEKILGVPSYSAEKLPYLTPGSIYHVIMHGKGIMGSHSSQLTYDERWKIVRYVVELRGEKVEAQLPEGTEVPTDSTVVSK